MLSCSCSCNFLCQWDMSRAVPRKMREVKLFTGDIQGLCTGRNKVFACTSNGAIRYHVYSKLGSCFMSMLIAITGTSDQPCWLVEAFFFFFQCAFLHHVCMLQHAAVALSMLSVHCHAGLVLCPAQSLHSLYMWAQRVWVHLSVIVFAIRRHTRLGLGCLGSCTT